MSRTLRIALTSILCLVLVLGVGGIVYYTYLKHRVETGLEENKVTAVPEQPDVHSTEQKPENILVIGSDDRGGDEGQEVIR